MSDLTGKRAVVTGASSGIGAGIASAFVAAGADVLLVGRDEGRLADVAASSTGPGSATYLAVDLTADGAPGCVVRTARERLGAVDVLVHSAGIFEGKPFAEEDCESLDHLWAVNVRAPFLLTQAALTDLRGGGSVIFVSSACGRVGFPGAVAYCVTKGAIEMMIKALAVELGGDGIRVNGIAPGWIRTPMNEAILADTSYVNSQLAATPLGRFGAPADVAPVAVFLASDSAQFVHGACYWVDGGYPSMAAA